jgi:hypothetical protein
MEKAAENPGGAGASGIAMGMGFAMAQQMGQAYSMGSAQQQQPPSGPPPIPGQGAAAEWFVAYDGQQAGPFDAAKLQEGARDGKLTRDTLVWKKGMAQWTKAGEIQEIADVIGTVPPPLPPR